MTENTPEEQTDETEEQQLPEDLEDLDPEDIDMEDLPPGLVPPRYLVGYIEPAVTVIGMILLTLVWYGTRNHLPQSLSDRNRFYAWVALNFVLLLVVPIIVIKLAFKRSLSDFGLQLGRVAIWWRYFVGFLIITVPVIIISARFADFQAYYSRYSWATESHLELAMFAGAWLVYFFSWEFFFRGFWLFGLAPSLGAFSIFVQMVPFVMMHFSKPEAESFGAVIAGLALGLMAYRSKSVIGCWLLHWLVAMVMYTVVFITPH
ncbi:MAG: CPBP family intramembrane glutamic endopeptidase [Armatimonadota bacterium]